MKAQWRRVFTGIAAAALRSGPDDARPIAHCRASLKVDGQDFAEIEAYGLERWLGELALALRDETY